jgi:hypothetical protein
MAYLKSILLSFSFSWLVCTCFAQQPLDDMVTVLKQNNFDKIYHVMDSIKNYQEKAIPKLIELLDDTSYVKLTNTADLIYPGASSFYGHGWIVNYDIDYVNVRAAWLIEKISFQDFGYKTTTIKEADLLKLHQQNYSAYLKTGFHDVDLKDKTPKQLLIRYRLLLAAKVKKWWAENGKQWIRFNALKEALASKDQQRQLSALQYLRFEDSNCSGLTIRSYQSILKPLVLKISKAGGDVKEQADLLLQDGYSPRLK